MSLKEYFTFSIVLHLYLQSYKDTCTTIYIQRYKDTCTTLMNWLRGTM